MRVIVIDDEQPAIDELFYLLGKYPDIEVAASFTNPLKALETVEGIKPDAVFLDIDMPHMDGLELALHIQALCPGIIVVFVTAYTRFALDAFKAYPLDYLLKPIKEARLDATVEHMRKQVALLRPGVNNEADLHIFCFGRFRLNAPGLTGEIKWGTRRVKELLMYLIDRSGLPATRSELVHALFGGVADKKTANILYVTVSKLRSLLESIDPDRKFINLGDDYALDIAPGTCDYTDFILFARQNAAINTKNAVAAAKALNLYTAPYLVGEGCAWALDSAAVLDAQYDRIALGLAGVHSSAGRLREAENVLLAMLLRNPFSEDAYVSLLDIYMKIGSRQAFAARYPEYTRILHKELGQKPSPLYANYYNFIKGR